MAESVLKSGGLGKSAVVGVTRAPLTKEQLMWTILVAILAGIILGALARLIMPGKQNVGVLITIALGAVGALLGSWISNAIFGTGDKIFSPLPFLIGLVVAVVLIAIYVGITGRRGTGTPRGTAVG
jgi:uncharacterized membrane protein YeaQ/YmgE (transglycosylase-associated protein family)